MGIDQQPHSWPDMTDMKSFALTAFLGLVQTRRLGNIEMSLETNSGLGQCLTSTTPLALTLKLLLVAFWQLEAANPQDVS